MDTTTCLGCLLANKQQEVYVIYENDCVTCILDIEPFNPGHTLIFPKQHILDVEEFDSNTDQEIMQASILISKAIKSVYQPDGITITQNGGVFNDLTHYHMHVIPRYIGQNFTDFYAESKAELVKVDLQADYDKLKLAVIEILNK